MATPRIRCDSTRLRSARTKSAYERQPGEHVPLLLPSDPASQHIGETQRLARSSHTHALLFSRTLPTCNKVSSLCLPRCRRVTLNILHKPKSLRPSSSHPSVCGHVARDHLVWRGVGSVSMPGPHAPSVPHDSTWPCSGLVHDTHRGLVDV